MIPDGLEQAAGREHALVQAKLRQACVNFCVDRIGHCDPDQAFGSQCHLYPFPIDLILATDNTPGALQIHQKHRPSPTAAFGQSGANHGSFKGMKSVLTMWMTLLK
jgi:hypothetical protein